MGLLSSSILACNNSNKSSDSVKKADKLNDSVFKNDINKEILNDADFMVSAFNTGLTEIEIGQLAQKNGLDQAVKDMGNSAVTDYSKMNETIKTLATKKSIVLPTETSKKSKKEIKELSEKSGNLFDRGYTKMLVEDRVKEIRTFENAEKDASDLDIKAIASETLPMLRKQLAAAEELKIKIPYY